MPNIPGVQGPLIPSVVTRVRVRSRALSIPGGLRVLCLVGEGRREEVLVDSAQGGGADGFVPDFSQLATDGYGRFFRLANTSIVSNRTSLLLNGSELRLLEEALDGNSFSSSYDARIDISTGQIELQSASIVDQGGILYSESSGNTGDGYLSAINLTDSNAPAETWTIRCTSVLKDSYGAPIREQATFIASGSVSGQLVDSYGQPFTWKSDGAAVDNGILSFAIYNPSPSQPHDVGDRYSIQVSSKVLQERDTLEARYIAEADLLDPQTFTEPEKLYIKHGQPDLENTLSFAAQLAFENGATSVLAVQAKPALPRRTSEIVLPAQNSLTGETGADGGSDPDDLIFPITAPGKPGADSEVHFFIINADGSEDQIFPNKVSFYDPDITTAFSTYEDTGVSADLLTEFMAPGSSGTPYSYTVVSDDKIEDTGIDGYISPIGVGSTAFFTASSASFTSEAVTDGKYIDVVNTGTANLGRWEITEVVSATTVRISRDSGFFATETDLKWQLLLPGESSYRVLFTTDLALASGKGLRVSYIDEKDEDFFDANWAVALDTLETQDLQILGLYPSQTFSAIQQAGRVHVERMSSTFYKRERVLFTGALDGLTTDNVLGVSNAAVENIGILEGIQGDSAEEILDGNIEDLTDYSVVNSFGDSFRVAYFYPDQAIRVVNGTATTIPGYWISAAAAGRMSGEPNIAQPLTNKVLSGITILNSRQYKETVLASLGDDGIIVCQPVTGGVRVIHGITTSQSGNPEDEELSIVFIRDHIARTMRDTFREFIGQPEDPTLIPSLTAKAISLLNAFVSQNLITAYRNLSVSRDDVEPRQYNIVVEVQPNYPVNWIFCDVSVGLF